jgi:uncharacterized protein
MLPPVTAPDEPTLALLRARSGLAIDAEGRFLHLGEPITHARTLEVLWRSLRRLPDGAYEVAIGRERARVEVRDAPYAVRGVTSVGGEGPPVLHLSDGSTEPLDPATLLVGADGVLRCTVKGGHRARFTRAGHVALGLALEEDPPGSGSYALVVNGRRWPIGCA